MKRLINILVTLFFTFLFIIVFVFKIPMRCLIKETIGISCPTCGMTRSFISIMNLDFYEAIKYNLLGIPFFIFFIISMVWLIKDIIKNEDTFFKKINSMLSNKKVIIIIFLIIIINTIINNIK